MNMHFPSVFRCLFVLLFVFSGLVSASAQEDEFFDFFHFAEIETRNFASISLRTDEEDLLIIEGPDRLHKLVERQDSTWKTSLVYMSCLKNLILDDRNTLDLKKNAERSQADPCNIVSIYDVDQDKKNDLIVQFRSSLHWMRNEGDGKYATPIKVGKELTRLDLVSAVHPGVILVERLLQNAMQFTVFDFRSGPADIKAQQMKLKLPIQTIGMQQEGEREMLVFRDQDDRIQFQAFGTTKSSREFPADDYRNLYSFADFNRDGNLDMVNSKDLDVRLFWGEGEDQLSKGANLLEPMDSAFMQEITSSYVPNQYQTLEEYKATCLDWLSSGSASTMDLNNDGYTDILHHQEFFLAFINEKDGTFTRKFIGGPYDPNECVLVDFNRDGNLEMIINTFDRHIYVHYAEQAYQVRELSSKGQKDAFLISDIDHDGDEDVLFYSENNFLEWSENNGATLLKAVKFNVLK